MAMIEKRHIILLAMAAAPLMASCVAEQLPTNEKGSYSHSAVPVRAVPSLVEDWNPLTKAVSDITDINDAGLQDKGFGVYAFYTGEESFSADKAQADYTKFGLVLNNRKFSYNAGTWENTGDAEFWPASSGENLSLFAYAPWDEWHAKVQYDGTTNKVPSIKYDDYVAQSLTEAELSKQRDLLWGTNTSGNPHKNVEKDDYDPEGTVDFHFRHALAKVKFGVKGTLPGEARSQTSSGTTSYENGSAGTPEDGETTSSVGEPVFFVANNSTYYRTGSGEWSGYTYYYVRYYHATQTQTETESYVQTRYRIRTETATGATYSTSGYRYLVERATFKGFNQKGTLLLDNTSAYAPLWTNVSRFSGEDPEYVLNGSNVLSPSLRYENAATIQSNFSTYSGIQEDVTDMMSGYFLYAIPRESTDGDRIAASIKYHRLNVEGTVRVNQRRLVVQKQTRTLTRTRTRTRNSDEIKVRSRYDDTIYWDYYYSDNESDYTFSAEWPEWPEWPAGGGWNNPSWGTTWIDDSYGEWETVSESLIGATVNYNDDPATELSGQILTSLQGGRAYDINLIVAGDKIELEVVPQPWELIDFDFDYNANINDVIQALTYDSSFIDYADSRGNVYINNRMGKFYFRLGSGKYSSWQASLVGDAAFGFTDENGNFLLDDHGNRVASVRGAIDPSQMNYLYIKAIDTEASVTSHAKLRIYLIDATGDAVVALNLVNLQGVTEWTIWQNAN